MSSLGFSRAMGLSFVAASLLQLVSHSGPDAHAGTMRCLAFSFAGPRSDALANAEGWMRFTALGSEVNDLRVTERRDGGWRLQDRAHGLRVGAQGQRLRKCHRVNSSTATAPSTRYYNRLALRLGGGDDAANVRLANASSTLGIKIDGADGNDRLTIHAGSSLVGGGVSGGAGDDRIRVAWPHIPHGRAIRNLLQPVGLSVTGGPGRDRLEVIEPTAFNRGRYASSPGPLRLSGAEGADTLIGNVGPDFLYGGDAADTIVLRGGGTDQVRAGSGDDTVRLPVTPARGTLIDCGDDTDTVIADRSLGSAVLKDCEKVIVAGIAR